MRGTQQSHINIAYTQTQYHDWSCLIYDMSSTLLNYSTWLKVMFLSKSVLLGTFVDFELYVCFAAWKLQKTFASVNIEFMGKFYWEVKICSLVCSRFSFHRGTFDISNNINFQSSWYGSWQCKSLLIWYWTYFIFFFPDDNCGQFPQSIQYWSWGQLSSQPGGNFISW